jgi:hypothetical protein
MNGQMPTRFVIPAKAGIHVDITSELESLQMLKITTTVIPAKAGIQCVSPAHARITQE